MKPFTLTDRDLNVILLIYTYDGLTPNVVQQRFWQTAGTQSSCYDRLARLIAAGYIKATPLPAATTSGGRGQRWLTLGPKAIPLVREQLGLSPADIHGLRHAFVPQFWRHEVLLRQVRLLIDLACTQVGFVELSDWQPERLLKRQPMKVPHKETATHVDLVPDGRFSLSLMGGPDHPYFLEVDRGTVSSKQIINRLKAYLLHNTDFLTPVLWVVPNRVRAAQLDRWAQIAARDVDADPRRFWLTTQDQLDDHAVLFKPIWQLVTGPRVALVPTTSAVIPPLPEQESRRLYLPIKRPPYITHLAATEQPQLPSSDDFRLQ